MEKIPNSSEPNMYQRFYEKNPHTNLSESEFNELRQLALQKGGGIKKFFANQGIVMEEQPTSEELVEMNDSQIVN